MRVRLATRGSKLAMVQAQLVAAALSAAHPEHEFVLEALTTHGDRHPTLKLSESPREGVFVKELEQALIDGRAELAVHSAKDLPTIETPGLVLAGFLPRADARDVLISRDGETLSTLSQGARIGTGSPRRAAQIAAVRPDLQIQPIRGNVDTRLRRLQEGVVDALILAAAGLERLGRLDQATEVLPFVLMLPAPGQGALAIQAVEGSPAVALVDAINDRDTGHAVMAERALLRRLGGGCLSALGAFATIEHDELNLQAVVLDSGGRNVVRGAASGRRNDEVVDAVAEQLERQGAAGLLNPRRLALTGLRVMVTRPDRQAASLMGPLRAEGAEVVFCPVIDIEPLPVSREQLAALPGYDWLVLTSANGVDRLFELLDTAKLPVPIHIKVAAIGPETAARLRSRGLEPALVPPKFVAEELADRLVATLPRGSRVLVARAAGSRDVLPDRLRAHGATVDVMATYRAVPPPGLAERLRAALGRVDLVTFTSASTVRHFLEAAGGAIGPSLKVAVIGPITAAAAEELGLRVDIIASEYTTRGLVDAIVRSRTHPSA